MTTLLLSLTPGGVSTMTLHPGIDPETCVGVGDLSLCTGETPRCRCLGP